MEASTEVPTSPPQDRGDQQDDPSDQPAGHTEPCAGVFCGRIQWDMTEDEVRDLFAVYGQITEMRMPMDPFTKHSKGYAFISFLKKEDAMKAISELNGKELYPGQSLKVARFSPKTRLFVANIPKSKDRKELHTGFAFRTDGLKEVIIYTSPDDDKKNRGFCFLDYESHTAATNAKRRLSTLGTQVWGCSLAVDWADPEQDVDPEIMAKVRILYVRNISGMVTEEELWTIFEQFGSLERVKKIKDFAFIHFASRDDAKEAKEALIGLKLHNVAIDIQWSKPPTDKESRSEVLRGRERRMVAQQARLPMRGIANPFAHPMGWLDGEDSMYVGGGSGDYSGQDWCWSPHPPAYFGTGPSVAPQGQQFFGDFTNCPRMSSSASFLGRSEDGFSVPMRWTSYNRTSSGGQISNRNFKGNFRRMAEDQGGDPGSGIISNFTTQRHRRWINEKYDNNQQNQAYRP